MSRKTDGLSYERAIEVLRYDTENGVLERRFKNGEWRICGHKPDHHGYGQVSIDGKKYKTHRLIWLMVHGSFPEHEIDHIDRDKMNNRIRNLRSVTAAENKHNTGLRRNNSSGYLGVSYHRQTNNYRAQIHVKGKSITLGYFDTAEEAFLTYQLAKIQYHPTSPVAQQYLRELTVAG